MLIFSMINAYQPQDNSLRRTGDCREFTRILQAQIAHKQFLADKVRFISAKLTVFWSKWPKIQMYVVVYTDVAAKQYRV